MMMILTLSGLCCESYIAHRVLALYTEVRTLDAVGVTSKRRQFQARKVIK